MRQELQQLGNLRRKMREAREVMIKPLDARSIKGVFAKWSSSGRWVALEQVDHPSHLMVWDTQTDTSQELGVMPHGDFMTFSWLPASAWLVYVKTLLYTTKQDFKKPSMFCHNMASEGRWELLDKPHRCCDGSYTPAVAPSGHVVAYVHSVCSVLLKAYCLDIFDVASATWIFQLPCPDYVDIAWAPTSSHLLISTQHSEVLLLDASK